MTRLLKMPTTKLVEKIVVLACLLAVTTAVKAQAFEWAKSFGGISDDIGQSITSDALGNVYSTGSFKGTVDFDPGAGTSNLNAGNSEDVFVQKMDASGNFLWAKSFSGSLGSGGVSTTLDALGNVYTTGFFAGTVDFDPGVGTSNLNSAGYTDVFIQKMDASGNFLWSKSFGGGFTDVGHTITIDALGNVYTTGRFEGAVDFDPGLGTSTLNSAGNSDVFVQKLDGSGNFLWAKSFGGGGYDRGISITLDTLGNLYTTGDFAGTVDFNPGVGTSTLTSAGGADIFVQKLDGSGNFLWAKSFGGTSEDAGDCISLDALGNVYTTGRFGGAVDFDPGAGTLTLNSAGNNDIFIQKLDDSGNFLWARTFGGTLADYSSSIIIDSLGNVYTSGTLQGMVDFDPGPGTSNLTSTGGFDIFVLKMNPCIPIMSIDVETACNFFTWIDGNTYFSSTNSATHTLTNISGCDSVVTLNLTINNSTGVDVQTACNSYTWNDGNTYTASNNTATDTLTNITGCDSVVTLNLTINSVSDISTSLSGVTITATNNNASYQWLDCVNNYSVINNETSQTFTANSNGSYSVELTENGCVDTTNCVLITTVGIVENGFGADFVIYPNPTSGTFTVSLDENYGDIKISITDINGRLIQCSEYKNSQILNLNIAEPMGVYLMTIESVEQSAIIRLVKQ